MAKYINADALRDELHKHENYKGGLSYEYQTIIADFPAADVRENVRGEWEQFNDSLWFVARCSVCGLTSYLTGKFCPNCGADMKGRSE